MYHQYPNAATLVKPNPRPIVVPTAIATFELCAFSVLDEASGAEDGEEGLGVVLIGGGSGGGAPEPVGCGVKIGGDEDGGRVMLGRIGSVVVRLEDRE